MDSQQQNMPYKIANVRIVECYLVTFIDLHSNNAISQDGQLTYYKTQQKVVLFGPKNRTTLGEYLHTTIPEPSWRVKGLQRIKSKATLTPDFEFVLGDRFKITIVRALYCREKVVKAASEQTEKQKMREVILRNIEAQDDILAELGSIKNTVLPSSGPWKAFALPSRSNSSSTVPKP